MTDRQAQIEELWRRLDEIDGETGAEGERHDNVALNAILREHGVGT